MSELEDFIRQNKEAFSEAEPTDGHTERFLRKIEKREEKSKESLVSFWRVAAAIIILIVLGISVLIPQFNSPDHVHYASMSLSDVSSDMADVELYYKSKLETEYDKLDALSKSDPEVKSYMDELDRLNNLYQDLEEQLYESGTHEKVIVAMIENFRLRLEIVEKLEKIKQTQSQKDSI